MTIPLVCACVELDEIDDSINHTIYNEDTIAYEKQLLRKKYQGKRISILGN